jgi:acyl-CoA synthetase (AMP-forming)/AMP-acid ligase II
VAVTSTAPTPDDLRARYLAESWWGRPQHFGAIESWAERAPDRVAIVDPYGRFTYGELETCVRRTRAWLEDRGVERGESVVAVLPNWFESVVVYHAVLRLGAIAVPLSTHARAAEIDHVVAATRSRLVVAPPSHVEVVAGLPNRRWERALGTLTAVERATSASKLRGGREAAGSDARADGVATVIYTSGSTADPKGAIHTHDTLAVANRSLTSCLGLGQDDVFYVVAPLAHIGGIMHGLHMPFETGARVVLDDRWEPRRAADRISAEGATFVGGAPVFAEGVVRGFAGRGGSPLRVVAVGGAAIPERLGSQVRDTLGARFVRSYGSTECPFATGSLPTDQPDESDADDGALTTGFEARIEGGGAEGELLLRGAAMFQGYLDAGQNVPALRDGWFVTGDLVVLRGDRVRVVGRLKAIVIRNGENISLDEVERALQGWHDAAEVAAFGLPDERTGERVAVAVVPSGTPTYERMVEHLGGRAMARQKYPEQIVLWDSLPRTASGKVDRRALTAGSASRPSELAPRLRADADQA